MIRVVAVEGILLLIFAILWLVTGTKPQSDVVPALLGLASMAMGLQSAYVRSIGLAGIATTALTSPLATLMTELARWVDIKTHTVSRTKGITGSQVIGRLAAVCLIYGFAALVGAISPIRFPAVAVFLPLIALLPVILDTYKRQRSQVSISTKGEGIEGRP